MPRCDTHMNHCTSCGSYALKDVAGDHGFRRTSACCSAPVSAGASSENHPAFTPTNRKMTEAEIQRARTFDRPLKVRASGSHANCDHPSTSAARRACRKARA